MGVTGVAIGTVAARFVEFAVCAWFVLSNPDIPFSLSDIGKSDPQLRKSFLSVITSCEIAVKCDIYTMLFVFFN